MGFNVGGTITLQSHEHDDVVVRGEHFVIEVPNAPRDPGDGDFPREALFVYDDPAGRFTIMKHVAAIQGKLKDASPSRVSGARWHVAEGGDALEVSFADLNSSPGGAKKSRSRRKRPVPAAHLM